MSSPTDPRFTLHHIEPAKESSSFADDVRAGLSARPKVLQPQYFYDDLGSHLFEAICHLPEYYPTRSEREILEEESDAIARALDGPVRLIELGSGSSAKTRHLLAALLALQGTLHYLPVDISDGILERTGQELVQVFPDLCVTAYAGSFEGVLSRMASEGFARLDGERAVLAFLGSTIGNFDAPQALGLLRQMHRILEPDDVLLLGADLKKPEAVLVPAYDDSVGVTAAFNKNLLARINRELGGDFDVRSFRHRAVYESRHGRVEMYLVSSAAQTVEIRDLDMTVSFEAGEHIHTESSHKYDLDQLAVLAREAGFVLERSWFDGRKYFSVNVLRS